MVFGQQLFGTWPLYVGAAVFYTAVTFRGELRSSKARIFSRDNARPLSSILTIHALFLTALLISIWVARSVLPDLPEWLTDTMNIYEAPMSGLELVFIFAGLGMHYIELRLLYVDANINSPDSNSTSKL